MDEVNQCAFVISVDLHASSGSTAWADGVLTGQMIHAFREDHFSRSFFMKKLAIDQIFPYHNNAFVSHASIESRAMTLYEAWWCMGEERDLCGSAFFLFLLVTNTTITRSVWKARQNR